jgi:hypothetical protein
VPKELDGRWEGLLKLDETHTLRIVIRAVPGADGRLRMVVDSPDQGLKDLPISAVALENGVWTWSIASLGARFEGKATQSQDAYEGELRQRGSRTPLILTKKE